MSLTGYIGLCIRKPHVGTRMSITTPTIIIGYDYGDVARGEDASRSNTITPLYTATLLVRT